MLCVSLGSAITDYKPDWIFCFAFKCFLSQCVFFKNYFLSVCLFGRQSQSGTLHLTHPPYPKSSTSHLFQAHFLYDSLWLCNGQTFVFDIKVERAGQLCCVLQSCASRTQCWVQELCESYSCESGKTFVW